MDNNNINNLVQKHIQERQNNNNTSKIENDIIAIFDPLIKAKALGFSNIRGVSFDDFVQEGRIAVVKALYSFKSNKKVSFSTFASTCINNGMLDLARKQASLSSQAISAALPIEEIREKAANKSPEDEVIYNELIANISKNLNEYQQKVFTLYIEGYSYEQIAQSCQKSKKDIDNCIQLIKKKIKDLI